MPSAEVISIDLHGLRFIEAKTELLDSIEGYYKQGFTLFEVIHGFKGGTVLRDYVRLSLKRDFEKRYKKCLITVKTVSKGSTVILLTKF